MKTNKTSKRALLTSVLSIALCLSMLIGTTFAWFTDTASTAVNKIQAGTLDVDIVDADNNTLNGKTLYFRDVNGKTNILWEPGATFNLDTFRIVNKGNLALKYKVVISGIDGSAELLNVINFTVKKGDAAPVELAGWEGVLLPEGATATATDGADVKTTGLIAISGKMDEQAGNQYQGLSIDGLGITVYATQANAENDSFGPDYDKDANGNPDHPDWDITANVTAPVAKDANGAPTKTTVANADKTVEVTVPAAAIDPAAENIELTVTPSSTPKVTVAPDQAVKAYDISVTGLADGNTTPVEVKLFVGKGLKGVSVAHKGTALAASDFSYDAATGIVTFSTTSFSPFDVTYTLPQAISSTGEVTYNFAADMVGKSWTMLQDVSVASLSNFNNGNTVIDLNGNKLTYTGTYSVGVLGGATLTMKNGDFAAVNTKDGYSAVFVCAADSVLTFDNMTMTGAGSLAFPQGKNATLNVYNSKMTAAGYCIGTNAASADYHGVIINIENSTIAATASHCDNTAIYLNVPCTATIENSTITGDRQGMFVRGGTAVITNSTIATTGKFSDDKTYLDGYWGTGNELPCGALVLGNRHNSTAYDYATDCTLNNVTLTAGNGVRTMYVYANAGKGIGTTLTYDAACKLGTIVYGTKENVTVNAPAAK